MAIRAVFIMFVQFILGKCLFKIKLTIRQGKDGYMLAANF